jgi:hypothetical protein
MLSGTSAACTVLKKVCPLSVGLLFAETPAATMRNTRFQSDPNASTVVDLLRSRNVVVFVGAGPSTGKRPYQDSYPSWTDLVKDLCRDCMGCLPHPNEWEGWRQPQQLQLLAQQAFDRDRDKYKNTLDAIFSRPVMAVRLVYALLMRMKLKSYVTTNFDPFLKTAQQLHQPDMELHVYPRNFKASEVSRGGVFYIHGLGAPDHQIAPDDIVLKNQDFLDAYGNECGDLPRFWQTMLRENNVIFLGSTLSDPYTQSALDNYRLTTAFMARRHQLGLPRSYALLPVGECVSAPDSPVDSASVTESQVAAQSQALRSLGIIPVLYDMRDSSYSGLAEVLDQVAPLPPSRPGGSPWTQADEVVT